MLEQAELEGQLPKAPCQAHSNVQAALLSQGAWSFWGRGEAIPGDVAQGAMASHCPHVPMPHAAPAAPPGRAAASPTATAPLCTGAWKTASPKHTKSIFLRKL